MGTIFLSRKNTNIFSTVFPIEIEKQNQERPAYLTRKNPSDSNYFMQHPLFKIGLLLWTETLPGGTPFSNFPLFSQRNSLQVFEVTEGITYILFKTTPISYNLRA